MKYEIEITRHNVTPATFLSYVRSQLKKHGLDDVFEAPSLDYLAAGNDLNFDVEHDGMHERSISKPYEMQTYIRWEDGTVYNLMCEFDFWDEKTGTGYFYAKDTGMEAHQEAQEAQEATESESVQEAQEKPTQEAQEATETEIAKTYVNLISTQILTRKARSAWERGVKAYAEELIEELREAAEGGYIDASDLTSKAMTQKALLNGAPSWEEYSWGGCSLIYDSQIANRLCAPWELRKTRNGEKKPNAREEWLDTQARALRQAAGLIEIARLAVMQEVM